MRKTLMTGSLTIGAGIVVSSILSVACQGSFIRKHPVHMGHWVFHIASVNEPARIGFKVHTNIMWWLVF